LKISRFSPIKNKKLTLKVHPNMNYYRIHVQDVSKIIGFVNRECLKISRFSPISQDNNNVSNYHNTTAPN